MMMLRLAALMFWVVMSAAVPAAYAQDSDDANPDMGAARNDVRISQLEEQVRKLQGTLEQQSFENKQLKAQLDKSTADMQFRMDALEKKQAAAPTPAPSAAPVSDSSQLKSVEPVTDINSETPGDSINGRDAAVVAATTPPTAAATQTFASPREHYNYAYRILQQAKYAEAGQSFESFIQKYPKDQLVGNAYYWLGETYYVRHDYVKAADSFRQGYEALPTGPKAADNLLKLAMALDALNKDKEACVVLKQVAGKLGNASASVKGMAQQEINRIGCN